MLKKFLAGFSAFLLVLLPMGGMVQAATLTNPIANPSAATAVSGAPTGWTQSSWTSVAGAITPTFQYVTNDGHNDSSSMKLTMANYDTTYVAGADDGQVGGALTGDDGDAKWIFDPINVTTGTTSAAAPLKVGNQYRFSMWYKTNTIPKVVVDYMDASGTESFYGMSNPQPSSDSATVWNQYTNTFSIPQGATKVTVFMFLDHNGWIQTDDYSISDYTPTGFTEPMVSLTFDDGQEDNVTNALPLLNSYGFKTTHCFETQTLINEPAQVAANVKAFQNAGHEICSHTITHPMLSQINDTQLTKELTQSKSFLENATGVPVTDFASPYGDYNAHVNDAIKAAGYASHRTVDEGFNSKDNFDAYRLRVQNISNTTSAAQVNAWVKQAQADKTWLILVYHRVVDTSAAGQAKAGYEAPGPFDTSVDLFTGQLAAIKASGIKVATMHDALAEVESQINPTTPPADTTAPVVSNVTVTGTTSNSTTISWTTDEASTATINYGTTASYGQSVAVTTSGTTHSVTLTGLTASTNYQYQIVAKDAANNSNSASTGSFGTLAVVPPADTTGPVISGNQATPTSNSVTINWSTDELATGQVFISTQSGVFGQTPAASITTATQSSSLNIGGLAPSTTYYYQIVSTDAAGNKTTKNGTDLKFTTTAVITVPGVAGDVNGDKVIDALDLSIVLGNWNKTGATSAQGDLNGDGTVDALDLSTVLGNWSK